MGMRFWFLGGSFWWFICCGGSFLGEFFFSFFFPGLGGGLILVGGFLRDCLWDMVLRSMLGVVILIYRDAWLRLAALIT